MIRGPVEMVIVEFPGEVPGTELAGGVSALVDAGVIRIIDTAFVTKDLDGTVTTFELRDRDGEPGYEALDLVVEEIDGLISDADLVEVAAEVSPGTTAAVMLFEHVWARELRSIVLSAGGEVVFTERIPAAVVEAVETAAA